MFSFQRILVPIDFGEVSRAAVKAACDLAERMSGQIVLLHVLSPAAVLPPLERVPVRVRDVDGVSHAQRQLNQIPESTDWRDLITERCIQSGDPATTIAKFASENGIDIIVMGTHSRSGLKHLLLGSVTESVVSKASCPVLTVPTAVAEYRSAMAH